MKKWALITGASSGIGKAFSKKLSSLGYNLVLISKNEKKLDELKKFLEKNYDNMEFETFAIDLSNNNYFNKIQEIIENKKITFLINNAGFGLAGEFAYQDINKLNDMLNVNCIAPLNITYLCLNKMIEQREGNIIFLGSLLSFIPAPYSTVYAATKSFNEAFACGLWYELKQFNINVLSINPGTVKTTFHTNAGFKMSKYYREPEDVVNTALRYLGKKPSVIDGTINRAIQLLNRFVSRKLLIKLAGINFKKRII